MRPARWVAGALVLAAVVGYGVADAHDVVPGVITLDPANVAAHPTRVAPSRTPVGPALPALSAQAPEPTTSGLARALGPLVAAKALGPHVGASVVDARTGTVLLDHDAAGAHVPASTTKLLTAAAVLTTVGGDTRLVTQVVRGATPGELVLVGGGDELLGTGRSRLDQTVGRAGLGTLATQVAAALRAQGRRQVVVRFDDSLLEGGDVSPTWDPADVRAGYTGRVTALGLARDRARIGHPSPADPSASAAAAFVTALRREGITVSGTPQRSRAEAGAAVLGRVESATVADVLDEALQHSDNALAELLARLTAHQLGRSTTFEDGAVAVMDQVQRLGVDTAGTRVVDGSGLGGGSVVPARVLAQVLTLAAGDREPRLRPILTGLPVAGFSGTLGDRFLTSPSHTAAGLVRAKTGTLTGVSALAGVTVDADGRLLVFVLMADHVPAGGTLDARAAADRVAAAVARCGCR